MRWKHTLPNSKALRDAIEEEDGSKVLTEIVNAYKWIESTFREDMSMEIANVTDDIECEAFDEDSANYHLESLYDECDARKVWIET